MTNPPPADKIPGKIKPRRPKGKKLDRPLERIHRGMPPVEDIHEDAQARPAR